MGLILYILSIILSAILLPFGFLFGFIKQIYKRQFFRSFRVMDAKFFNLAASIDRYGNICCAELFNAILIKDSVYLFGNGQETISSVLGRNLEDGKLTRLGFWLHKLLCWLHKDHCVKSIGK